MSIGWFRRAIVLRNHCTDGKREDAGRSRLRATPRGQSLQRDRRGIETCLHPAPPAFFISIIGGSRNMPDFWGHHLTEIEVSIEGARRPRATGILVVPSNEPIHWS
jgi:hypothetical protein